MESAWKEVQPKNIYRAAKQLPLRDHGKESLIHLYQPIIGADGLSLYFSLLGDIVWEYGMSESMLHADILTDCNIGLQQFYEARLKLEGIGLLSTFRRQDAQLGTVYLYQLQDPLTPEVFLKDSLLTFLLEEQVSENKFKALIKRFKPKKIDTSDYQEITHNFSEVYNFQEEQFAVSYESLASCTEQFEMPPEPNPSLQDKDTNLDWELLKETLTKLGIHTDFDEAVSQEIQVCHAMYGMNEVELSELLAKTADVVDNTVDLKAFRRMVRQIHQKKKAPAQAISPDVPEDFSEEDKKTYRYNSLKLEGFNESDIQIIEETEKYPPMTYFEAIKEQKGGYVTDPETWIIRDLINKSGLPNSVINFLINYVLIVKNSPSLNAAFVNTIANEWAQSSIRTPEAALKHVREVNQKKAKTAESKKNNRYSRHVRKEKVPEWMNKKTIPEATLSPERQAELDEKLKEYLGEGD